MSPDQQPKQDYQKNCRPVASVVEEISRIYKHPDWQIEKFAVWGVTPNGATIRISFVEARIRERS